MDSSFSSDQQRSGLSRRPVDHGHNTGVPPPGPGSRLHPDIDPPPKARPAFQILAFGFILFFASLQFLPATHFRDPSDPLRSWIPVDPGRASASSSYAKNVDGKQLNSQSKQEEIETLHIVSWIDCLDLRVLAVLINSTLTATRSPKNVYFHFFIPESDEDKLPYYKMKVLFPHSNLDIIGKNEIKEKIVTATPEGEQLWPLLPELAPFIISHIKSSLRRFIYLSPVTIMKENIEELFKAKLGHYAIAAVEDCSKTLGNYVNIEVVNAIQRTAAKPWVSKEPYDENACIPDLNVLLVDGRKLQNNFLEAILWWSKILSTGFKRSNGNPSTALALYSRYLKLPTAWKFSEAKPQQLVDVKVQRFDGKRRTCLGNDKQHQETKFGDVWQQYLSPNSELILDH